MSRHLLPALLLLVGLHGSAEDILYRSNDFGMLLSRIPPFMEHDSRWVLKIHRAGTDEDRRLFDRGKEVRRWQVAWNREKTEKVERESAGGALAARRVYDATGSLLQEEEYAGALLAKKTLYKYANGRVTRKRILDGDGKTVSSETYLYAANGALREVRRSAASDAAMVSSVVQGPAGLSETRSSLGDDLFVERFGPDGRMVNRERAVDGRTLSVEDFTYDPVSGTLASSRESRPSDTTVVDRRYDGSGRLSQETTTVKGAVSETSSYEHDEKGRETVKLRRSAAGLETWKKSYADSGSLLREEYYKRGILVKATVHGQGKLRTEELYKEGELFLKVFYEGDTRLREEVWANGRIQRERSYP